MNTTNTRPSDAAPASFVLLYQEPVANAGAESGTGTATREQPDYLQSHTRTDARESDDTDMSAAHATFPLATQTQTEARENVDSDVHAATFPYPTQAMTKTGTREHDDNAITVACRAFPLETMTTTKVGREQDDTDVGSLSHNAFPRT